MRDEGSKVDGNGTFSKQMCISNSLKLKLKL